MTYQTLVVKDTQYVNKWWKWSIVVILFLIMGAALTIAFSFHALLQNYNRNCIANTKLKFKTIERPTISNNPDTETLNPARINLNNNEFINWDEHRINRLGNYTEQLRTYFSNKMRKDQENEQKVRINILRKSKKLSIEEKMESTKQQIELNEEDIIFFDTKFIDESDSNWGSMTTCDYLSYVPLTEAIIATIWITLFLMCGNGGRSNHAFVEEPWRIVLPALVFFVVMTIISAIHQIILTSRLNHFCDDLKSNFYDKSIPCSLVINRFSFNDELSNHTLISAALNYNLSVAFSWIRLALWALAVAVMMLRCVYGTDFEMIDIPLSLLGYHSEQPAQQQGKPKSTLVQHHIDNSSQSGEDEMDDYNVRAKEKIGPNYYVSVDLNEPDKRGSMTSMSYWPPYPHQQRLKLINEVGRKHIKETPLNM